MRPRLAKLPKSPKSQSSRLVNQCVWGIRYDTIAYGFMNLYKVTNTTGWHYLINGDLYSELYKMFVAYHIEDFPCSVTSKYSLMSIVLLPQCMGLVVIDMYNMPIRSYSAVQCLGQVQQCLKNLYETGIGSQFTDHVPSGNQNTSSCRGFSS